MLSITPAASMAQAVTSSQATTAAPVTAIYVSEFEVTDPEGIKPYSAGVDATFAPFGGRYIVRGGTVASLEGGATKRVVMIQFPSMEQARAWYDSPAYRALRPIRHQSATSKVFIVNGVTQP
ncbi:DUF1330 domain-containing protein [Pigmentiphaga litoralis]|uniref:DUF1330 domain-containing protein n=1 Tax=Pigmentiphaga litoralis TaxID=516702 RepID=UPI001673F81A|nr:DUF1330 domain-containing protein [Pigmentiphaga litoralis]